MNRLMFTFGLAVVVLSNAVLLVRVAGNRSGGPVQTMELTDTELPMMPREPEDTSVSLRIAWRPFYGGMSGSQVPRDRGVTFDPEKLRTLGFRLSTPDQKSPDFRAPQRRLLFVALEYSADRSETPSRLRAVDAAASYDELRARYPDAQRHLIVRGIVDAWPVDVQWAAPRWEGHVAMIVPSEVQVPLPYSKTLGNGRGNDLHYAVMLQYGRNLEPWVGSIRIAPRRGAEDAKTKK